MTPERLRRLRQLHAVCVEADCRVSAKSLGECLDEIERLRASNERQAAALRAVWATINEIRQQLDEAERRVFGRATT